MWTLKRYLRCMALAPTSPGALVERGTEALAAPLRGAIKITSVKALQLDYPADGCLIKIETDAGITGYGEAGVEAAVARARIPALHLDRGRPSRD